MTEYESLIRKRLFELAGPVGDVLLESAANAQSYLSDPDDKLRHAALVACAKVWKKEMGEAFIEKCKSLACGDPYEPIRMGAVVTLGDVVHGTKNADVSSFLSDLILDERHSKWLRYRAYFELRRVQFGFEKAHYDHCTMILQKQILERHPDSARERRLVEHYQQKGWLGDVSWEKWPRIDYDFVRQFSSR